MREVQLSIDAVEEGVANIFRQLYKGGARICLELLNQSKQRTAQVSRALPVGVSHESEFVRGSVGVRNDFGCVNFKHSAEAVAALAGAVCRIEREAAWFQRRHIDAAVHTRHSFGVQLVFAVNY